jgi:hypothetical protein
MRRKYSDLEALKRKLGGANKPPQRAPAKEISNHHSKPPQEPTNPPKELPREQVDDGGLGTADTVHSVPPEINKPNGTMPASPNGKRKRSQNNPTITIPENTIEYVRIFHNRRRELIKIIDQHSEELRAKGVKRVYVELRLFETKFSVSSIKSEPAKGTEVARKILQGPFEKKLEEFAPDVKGKDFEHERRIGLDPKYMKDGAPLKDIFHWDVVSTKKLSAPEVQKPINKEILPDEALGESEQALELEIETAQVLPDENNSYFFALSDAQGVSEFYLVRRINEGSLGFFRMDPKTNEIIDNDNEIRYLKLDQLGKDDPKPTPIIFGRSPNERFRVVVSNFMDGTPAFMIKNWESTGEYPAIHEPIGYGQEIATGIVAAVAVASIPLLPTIAKFMSNYTNVMSFPETVNLSMPVFGKLSLSLNAFLGWSAATLAALESAIISLGVIGRDKQQPR